MRNGTLIALTIAEPIITAHLAELRMDTPEDNALLDEIRKVWQPVVDELADETGNHLEFAKTIERWRQHSVLLNKIGWRIADFLGDIPEGATSHEGDVVVDLERLIDLYERNCDGG